MSAHEKPGFKSNTNTAAHSIEEYYGLHGEAALEYLAEANVPTDKLERIARQPDPITRSLGRLSVQSEVVRQVQL